MEQIEEVILPFFVSETQICFPLDFVLSLLNNIVKTLVLYMLVIILKFLKSGF